MTEVKTVQMSIPAPIKAGRRTKKQKEISGGAPSVLINKTNVKKEPVILQQKAGDPVPALSTTRVVGGNITKPDVKSVLKVPIIPQKDSLQYNKSTITPSPIKPVKIMPVKKPVNITRKSPEPIKIHINPKNRPNKTLKKYTAKKITITMEPTKNVRKIHDNIRLKVANMPLEEITKKLRAGGLLRETANPPESIQRLMMKDLLLFPTPI